MDTEHLIGATTRPYSKLTYQEAFERIARAGYSDVAVFANAGQMPVSSESTEAEVAVVRKAAENAGVAPSMLLARTRLGEGLAAAVEDYRRLVDNAAALGVRWLLELGTGNEEHYDDYFELMRRAGEWAEERDIRITMKPHGGISLTADNLLEAHQRVGHDAFGICFDPGNIVYYTLGERRPETDVGAVAGVVTTFIVKDCVVEGGKADVMVTAGDGLVDFPSVLGQLVAAGFEGPLYVECVSSVEPAEVDRDLAHTLGYVRGVLSSLQR